MDPTVVDTDALLEDTVFVGVGSIDVGADSVIVCVDLAVDGNDACVDSVIVCMDSVIVCVDSVIVCVGSVSVFVAPAVVDKVRVVVKMGTVVVVCIRVELWVNASVVDNDALSCSRRDTTMVELSAADISILIKSVRLLRRWDSIMPIVNSIDASLSKTSSVLTITLVFLKERQIIIAYVFLTSRQVGIKLHWYSITVKYASYGPVVV